MQVVAAFNILLSDKQVKAILVNIFGMLPICQLCHVSPIVHDATNAVCQ